MRQALSDLRVVELGSGVAAGWCGKVFADLGADVVKVEPPDGDALRADAGMFAHLHTNKRSVVVEVAPAASASLAELLDGVDLVIEAPGLRSLADWGIDRDELLAEQPALTVVAITGFGLTGPYAGLRVERPRRRRRSAARSSWTSAARSSCRCRSARRRWVTPPRSARSPRSCGLAPRASAPSSTAPPSKRSRPRPARVSRHLGWEYADHAVDGRDGAHQQRHAAAARGLPLRRRLRGDDDDDAAARPRC